MLRGFWRNHLQFAIPLVLLALVVVAVLVADVTQQLYVVSGLGVAICGWLLVPVALRLQASLRRRYVLKHRYPDLAPGVRRRLDRILFHLQRGHAADLTHAGAAIDALDREIAADRAAAPPGPLAAVVDLPNLLEGFRGVLTVRAITLHRESPGLLNAAFPELERQIFCRGIGAMSKRALVDELATAPLSEFDRLLRRLCAALDLLVDCTALRHLLPAAEAEHLLIAMVGRSPARAHGDCWTTWWHATRPRLARAGGVALVAMRLLRDLRHNQVYQLGQRVWQNGVPGADLMVLLDIAAFYRFWTRRRHSVEDTADRGRAGCPYFTEGRYINVADFLRFPLIDAPRALQFCKTYPELRQRKIEFVHGLIDLLAAYPGEMDRILAETLIRQIGDVPRQALGRGGWSPTVWRDFWLKLLQNNGFECGLENLVAGVTHVENGNLPAARTAFESAARLMPDATAPVVNLVYVECLAGRADHARRAIEEILDARPNQGSLALGLGRLAFYHLHDLPLAEKLFSRAQKLMFEPVDAHNHLGHICLITNRAKLAQDHFRRAYELDPGCPEALLNLARTMIELKMYWRAIDYLKTVTLQYPGITADWANFYLFQTYKEIGQDRDAIERLKHVPAMLLDDPDILDEISYYLESQHEYPWALDLQRRAMLARAKLPPKSSLPAAGGSGGNPWDDAGPSDSDDGGLKEGPAH